MVLLAEHLLVLKTLPLQQRADIDEPVPFVPSSIQPNGS